MKKTGCGESYVHNCRYSAIFQPTVSSNNKRKKVQNCRICGLPGHNRRNCNSSSNISNATSNEPNDHPPFNISEVQNPNIEQNVNQEPINQEVAQQNSQIFNLIGNQQQSSDAFGSPQTAQPPPTDPEQPEIIMPDNFYDAIISLLLNSTTILLIEVSTIFTLISHYFKFLGIALLL
jgi:hypothetical protein